MASADDFSKLTIPADDFSKLPENIYSKRHYLPIYFIMGNPQTEDCSDAYSYGYSADLLHVFSSKPFKDDIILNVFNQKLHLKTSEYGPSSLKSIVNIVCDYPKNYIVYDSHSNTIKVLFSLEDRPYYSCKPEFCYYDCDSGKFAEGFLPSLECIGIKYYPVKYTVKSHSHKLAWHSQKEEDEEYYTTDELTSINKVEIYDNPIIYASPSFSFPASEVE